MNAVICWMLGHMWHGPRGRRRNGFAFLGDVCFRCGKTAVSHRIRVNRS